MKKARIILVDIPQPYTNRHQFRSDNPDKRVRWGIGVAQRYNNGVMTQKDLLELGKWVKMIAAPDAYIFFWMTKPNLPFCCRILGEDNHQVGAWGTYYMTTPFTWIKLNSRKGSIFKGNGAYNFSNAEDVALARYPRTTLWHPNNPLYKPEQPIMLAHERYPKDVHSPIWEERHPSVPPCRIIRHNRTTCERCQKRSKIVHSRKPEEAQDRIDHWLDPYLDGYCKVELFATRQRISPERYKPWVCLGHDLTGTDIRDDLEQLAAEMRD